ncbi:MAG: hypothetical protein QOE41_185 [Mycobacterium sp.]|jgi:hypothetical protein|nr:hypothetical protein [Mycobacterium sp.]MDT5130874.1 hypothetical protein [Mycobacterium sp.]
MSQLRQDDRGAVIHEPRPLEIHRPEVSGVHPRLLGHLLVTLLLAAILLTVAWFLISPAASQFIS